MIKLLLAEAMPHISKATVILKGTVDDCTLVILCDTKEKGVKINPISVKGSADEVEKALPEAIKAVFTDNKELLTNYKEVAETVKKTAAKTTAKTAKTETPVAEKEEVEEEVATPKKEEFKPNKEQKGVIKKAQEALEKAKTTTDLDMINYLDGEYTKQYEKAAMPEEEIKNLKAEFEKIRVSKAQPEGKAEESDGLFAEPVKKPEPKSAAKKTEDKKPDAPTAIPVPAPVAKAETEDDGVIF